MSLGLLRSSMPRHHDILGASIKNGLPLFRESAKAILCTAVLGIELPTGGRFFLPFDDGTWFCDIFDAEMLRHVSYSIENRELRDWVSVRFSLIGTERLQFYSEVCGTWM